MNRFWKLALLGDPVAHSLSPQLQNAALEAAGLEGTYELIRCPAGELSERLPRLIAEGFAGLNLTVPLKEEGSALLDRLSPEAGRLGAVNTLRLAGGQWEGHNTDLAGFSWAAREHFGELAGRRILLLGAGGAAHAVVAALVDAGAAHVDIWNRDGKRALRLAGAFMTESLRICRVGEGGELDEALAAADILIQATSLGLGESDPLPPLPPEGRSPAVMDLVTRETPWLAACKKRGCRAADGRLMLIGQGAAAFAYWTGTAPPREAMRRALGFD